MNTLHLKSMIVIVEEGSLNKAAQKLFITPPSLSQQISLLESEVGFKIFDRTKQGMRLTKSGELFYEYARKMIGDLDATVVKCRALEGKQNPLSIVYFDSHDIHYLEEFTEQYPQIEVRTVNPSWNGTNEIYRMLKDGKVDIFFGEENKNSETLYDCEFMPLAKDHLSVLVSNKHPLHTRKSVSIEDLKDWDLTTYSRESPVIDLLEQFPQLHIGKHIDTNSEIINDCLRGGIFIGEDVYLNKEFSLNVIPIVPHIPVRYGIAYSKNNSNPSMLKYLRLLRDDI